jgi:hypothetical protein
VKKVIFIFIVYVGLLTVLPSVRALKVYFIPSCVTEKSCETNSNMGCETSNFIMSLSFNALQYINVQTIYDSIFVFDLLLDKINLLPQNTAIILGFKSAIWHPPKL